MQFIKKRLESFFNRRGRETLPVAFDWRRIYVLPSKPGLFFAVIWFVMLMAGLNFNNNMGLMLVFLLFGMAQVMLLKTFFNMRNVTLNSIKADPVFLGEVIEAQVELTAVNDRWQLVNEHHESVQEAHIEKGTGYLLWLVNSVHRGRQALPRFKLLTRYPMGLFTVWVYATPKVDVMIYPKPERPMAEFPAHGGLEGDKSLPVVGDEISGIREYQVGDPVRDIAWKKTAQTDKTWVKQFEVTQGKHMLFDFEQMGGMDLELKLSRLCAWVLQAEHENVDYQLKLPGFISDMSHGAAHLSACLEALALYGGGASPGSNHN